MSESLRKGWCPGALRPMPAKDGLLVRLRITGGIVPATTARALADLAALHGNGLFDLSARANLQMRGVGGRALPGLLDGLRALGLLDADADGEAVRNVIASPLAGCHRGFDIKPLVAALEARFAGDATLHGLPAKFGFLVDDGGTPSLASVSADVRFDWIAEESAFAVGLGGTRRDAVRIGSCPPEALVERAERIAHGALSLVSRAPTHRRMRDLIDAFGIDLVAGACGGARHTFHDDAVKPHARSLIGLRDVSGLATLGLGAPFGRLDGDMLRVAADVAETTVFGELRLTPWRCLLVPGIAVTGIDCTALREKGFIVDADDPRLAVAACVGRDGCERGTTATRDDAEALADLAASLDPAGTPLHLSGCEKGCANPSASAITLVGREGRYDLVQDGRASDPPIRRDLDLEEARAAIASLLVPA